MSTLKVDQLEEATGSANVTINTGSDLIVDDNIQLGHDSDTTLARASSGVMSVEGKSVYMAGGTDVAVADGGTGAGTATAGFDALSPMTTAGDIMYGGSSGTGTRLAASTDGHVLTATGAGSAPAWEAIPAISASDMPAGSVVQVNHLLLDGISSVSWNPQHVMTNTPLTLSITPSSSSNKILISWQLFGECGTVDRATYFDMTRGSTVIRGDSEGSSRLGVISLMGTGSTADENSNTPSTTIVTDYLDSPAVSTAVTYTVRVSSHGAFTFYINQAAGDANSDVYERGLSWITLKEIKV